MKLKKIHPFLLLILSLIASIFLLEIVLKKIEIFSDPLGSVRLDDESILLSDNSIIEYLHYYDEDIYQDVMTKDLLIVAIGDSFTEGYGVDFNDQYTKVLERQFRDESVGILNMGLGNSSPDQQLKIFEKHIISRMNPDLVIWQFYPNDIWDSLTYPLFNLDESNKLVELNGKDNWLYKVRSFYKRFSFLGAIRKKSYIFRFIMKFIEHKHKFKELPNYVDDEYQWAMLKIRKEMDYMESLSKERGFDLIYVLVAPQLIYEDDPGKFPKSSWIIDAYADMKKIFGNKKYIEAKFINENKKEGIFAGEEEDMNPYGDRHFNERGYELMGKKIHQSIVSSSQSAKLE